MARGEKNESKLHSGDLSSDFDRISLTPDVDNHQLFGRRKASVLCRYTPPNILLIDFTETVSRRADEVTNWRKRLALSARSPCSSWFGLLYFLLLSIMTRVEDFNYFDKVKEAVEVLEIQRELVPMWRLCPFGI